jgi:NAD(P)-dependent dehydrogenase (short-subunit alcohol dehydrogenase family)
VANQDESTGWLVLTGATSAIGGAVAALWRARGGKVLGISRRPPEGGGAEWIQADLRDPWGTAAAAAEVVRSRRVEAFVHAAGLVYADEAVHTTPDEWDQTLAVNLTAPFALAKVLTPRLVGVRAVVMVSSIDADMAPAGGPDAAYGAAKGGMLALVRHLAVEWGAIGVRVNAVLPGPMAEGMGIEARDAARYAARAADGRLTTAEEVAQAIMFLLGATGTTGQAIRVDHGFGMAY